MHPLLKRINDRIADAARGEFSQEFLTNEVAAINQQITYEQNSEAVSQSLINQFQAARDQLQTFIVGGVTIPNNPPVAPVQALVDTFIAFSDPNNQNIDLSHKNITHFDANVVLLRGYGFGYTSFDLSHNALPSADVEGILASWATCASPGQTLDISGGTNAAPLQNNVHQDGVASFPLIDGAGLPNGYELRIGVQTANNQFFNVVNIFEQGDASLDQSDGSSSNIFLHTGDNPTADEKAAFLATCAIFNNTQYGISFSYNSGTKRATITFTNDVFLPLGSGMDVAGSQGGNTSLNILASNGVSITTN